MALDNYVNLKAAVKRWSHRKDIGGDELDEFILIAETEFYNGVNDPTTGVQVPLRVREMEELDTSATNTTTRFLALPTDYLDMRRLDLTVSDNRKTITYESPNQLRILSGASYPCNYTITDQVEFDIQPDAAYVTNLQYFQRLNALDSTNNTNAILTKYPNIYLYGTLWALFQWARNTEEEGKFFAKFLQAVESANSSSYGGRYGAGLHSRVRGSTP